MSSYESSHLIGNNIVFNILYRRCLLGLLIGMLIGIDFTWEAYWDVLIFKELQTLNFSVLTPKVLLHISVQEW